jgi:hypothetical protein
MQKSEDRRLARLNQKTKNGKQKAGASRLTCQCEALRLSKCPSDLTVSPGQVSAFRFLSSDFGF